MKKHNSSRWILRQLEERIVYGIATSRPAQDVTLKKEPERSQFFQDTQKELKANADSKGLVHSEDANNITNPLNVASIMKDCEKQKGDLAGEKEEIFDQECHAEIGQNFISLPMRTFLEESDQTEQADCDTLDQVEEIQEELFREEEERREFETVLAKKRRKQILRAIEEEDDFQLQSDQSFRPYESPERMPILEIPEREELESIYKNTFSELEKLGFDRKKLFDLMNQEENGKELRKLTNKVLHSKLYGRGPYKLIVQQFVYDQLIHWLTNPPSE